MGLRTDCALWVLVLAASGCTFPGIQLGEEDSNHGTAQAGAGNELGTGGASATSNATGGSTQASNDATGGTADDPNDATGGTADDPNDATGGTADDPNDATGGTADDPNDATGGTTDDPDCVPRDVVLPERCGNDDDCVATHGSGWTCDAQNTVQDACGNEVAAPTCVDSGEPGPDECEPMTYYGPMPCSEDADCVEQNGEGWVCDLTATVATDSCGNTTVWPTCIDSGEPGPVECVPLDFYGPQPCTADADCIAIWGDGWVCDQNATVTIDSCGNTSNWPTCVDSGEPGPDECEPMTYYGPMPCSEDADCVEQNGEGWVCDLTATVATDTCGNTTVWPTCIDSGEPGPVECEPLDIYGPMPCSEDADCVEQSGEGWVCDLTATVATDTCGNTTVWPTCIDSGESDSTDPDDMVAWYGPQPCTDDANCVERYGEGWYCDASSTPWPICAETTEE